mmetsp:Transcript_37622/g.95093  ORF Transcript_37622/g.95093 Transcript_37622/m.95093 type:complete len:365 (-) Transcript_37622:53-1147(-)
MPLDYLARVRLVLLLGGVVGDANVVVDLKVEERAALAARFVHDELVESHGGGDDEVLLDVHHVGHLGGAHLAEARRQLLAHLAQKRLDRVALEHLHFFPMPAAVPVAVRDLQPLLLHHVLLLLPLLAQLLAQLRLLLLAIPVWQEVRLHQWVLLDLLPRRQLLLLLRLLTAIAVSGLFASGRFFPDLLLLLLLAALLQLIFLITAIRLLLLRAILLLLLFFLLLLRVLPRLVLPSNHQPHEVREAVPRDDLTERPKAGLHGITQRRRRQRLPHVAQQHQQAVQQHVAPVALHVAHVDGARQRPAGGARGRGLIPDALRASAAGCVRHRHLAGLQEVRHGVLLQAAAGHVAQQRRGKTVQVKVPE